ncbi:MAG: 4Fe-4S binding protein, partial [Bacteroidales bacterium]|nr:4Fe-4S binding protein [Bacteroidales bacterium]
EEGSNVMIPALNSERCIGCGACEYYCPSRPFSAIYVEGNDVHMDM